MQTISVLSPSEIEQLKKELLPQTVNTVIVDRFNPNNSGTTMNSANCSGQCRTGACIGSM